MQKGDTLTKIANKYQTSVKDIQRLNPTKIKNVDKISVGMVLQISTPFSVEPSRCNKCEALNKALKDIENLPSVKELLSLIGD